MTKQEKLAYAIAQRLSPNVSEQYEIGQKIINGQAQDLMKWYADRVYGENQYSQESASIELVGAMRDCHNSDIMQAVEDGIQWPSDLAPFELSAGSFQQYYRAMQELFEKNNVPISAHLVQEAYGIQQAHFIADHAVAKFYTNGEVAKDYPDFKKVIYDIDVKKMMQELSNELYGNGQRLTASFGNAEMHDLRFGLSQGIVSELKRTMPIEFDFEKLYARWDKFEEIGTLHMPYEGMEGFNPEKPFAIYREMTEEEKDLMYGSDSPIEDIEAAIAVGEIANPGSAEGFVYMIDARDLNVELEKNFIDNNIDKQKSENEYIENNDIDKEINENPELVAPCGR